MVVLREEVRSRLVGVVLNISETTTKTETETTYTVGLTKATTDKQQNQQQRRSGKKRASRVIRTITVREGKSRLKPGGRDGTGQEAVDKR